MLYARWQQIVRDHADVRALSDLASGRRWSFRELAGEAEGLTSPGEPFVHPKGHTPEFIFEVLHGWRTRRVVWPLEPSQTAPALPAPPAQCVHLKTTSASTGTPRVVAFTASQLATDASNIVATMGLRPDWPNLGVISLAHSYGFSNLVLPLLLHGIPLILAPSPLPEAMRQAAADYPALTLPAVPALWRAWHEAAALPPNVRLAISAGAPLSAGLEQTVFRAYGLKIHNFYGATECGGIAYDASPHPREDDAFVGAPMSNVRLALSGTGCLTVQSGAAGETYWPVPDLALGNGRFETSDLAELRDDRVYLRGRASDQINVAGRKVLPDTIEQALRAHPGVRECIVFGVPSPDAPRAETIVACVATEAGVGRDALRSFLLTRLPEWCVPREWRFVPELATNARGKISRAEWRQRFVMAGSGLKA